ncbi:MAG: phenylpyruvate tautomerase MIF-related protein [Planctomycetota bacterium]|jgi:phenylpyruvate tautomerase PptA (4-oxalocrotonate tautomerase family)
MPWIGLKTSAKVADDKRSALLTGLSDIVADDMGKPKQYVMVSVEQANMMLGGSEEPSAFLDLRSIGGLSPSVNGALSEHLCALMEEQLGIPSDRTYITYSDIEAGNWGWQGRTFG